ncbi:MAG TPA: DUF349 domain-containing protein, partial [Caldimonas sp.]
MFAALRLGGKRKGPIRAIPGWNALDRSGERPARRRQRAAAPDRRSRCRSAAEVLQRLLQRVKLGLGLRHLVLDLLQRLLRGLEGHGGVAQIERLQLDLPLLFGDRLLQLLRHVGVGVLLVELLQIAGVEELAAGVLDQRLEVGAPELLVATVRQVLYRVLVDDRGADDAIDLDPFAVEGGPKAHRLLRGDHRLANLREVRLRGEVVDAELAAERLRLLEGIFDLDLRRIGVVRSDRNLHVPFSHRPSSCWSREFGPCILATIDASHNAHCFSNRSNLLHTMLDWMFKKNQTPVADRPEGTASELDAGAHPVQVEAAAASVIDWQLKLQAATGDDTALLALAREGAPVDVMLAAVSALTSEAALKLAEREHRGHDRRVHRLAKQRYLAHVASRETEEHARRLIEAAGALVKEPLVPANRLVELDRAWQKLNTTLLDATQRAEFDALLAQLVARTHERGDRTLKVERWTAEARQALAHLHAACTAAATGTQDREHLAAAGASAHAVFEAAPAEEASAALRESLHSALQNCAQLDERLAILDELLQASAAPRPASLPGLPASDARTETAATPRDPASRWLQLPPLADAHLVDALAHRFEQWQQARDQARQARRTERRERALDRERQVRSERTETLATALEQAEAALAAGHLADTHKHLVEVDELLHGGASATSSRSRIDAVQAEYTRLKGWRHWGGGLARDELVLQAEALAAATLGEPGADIVKLSIRQQAEVIDDLRARWKELDRLGGATSRLLWQRFDTALKTAYRPVATHLDVQRAARAQNLQAREQLVDALNAVALPDSKEGDVAPDWKSPAAALERFQTEWRKLGPLEHTVPHKERDRLVESMGAAVLRLEAPLNEARRSAQLDRERLLARAKALASEASAGAQGRELVAKVRELQAEWQHHAAALPLARAIESALWARFKADI